MSLLTAFLTLSTASMEAQSAAPKVGGNSTFDSPGANDGSGGSGGRRKLTTVTAIPEDFSTLKLATGFLLSMDVYDAPELSGQMRIDEQGNITVPMAGPVHVVGLTMTEAAAQIAKRLQDAKILNNPQVNLNIDEYAGQNITVLGEVHNPGRMELLAPHNLADVIALAGGETQMAGNQIEIRHAAGVTPQKEVIHYTHNSEDMTLSDSSVRPGDTINVLRAGIVYVLGGVSRPGGYVMQEGGELNVTQALSLAYGTTMPAAVGSMRLIRKLPDGKVQEMPIAYRDMIKGKVPPPRMQAEDVLYVPISKIKTILSQSIFSSAAQAAIYVYH